MTTATTIIPTATAIPDVRLLIADCLLDGKSDRAARGVETADRAEKNDERQPDDGSQRRHEEVERGLVKHPAGERADEDRCRSRRHHRDAPAQHNDDQAL